MADPSLPRRILLVEPNAALRSAIISVLEAAQCAVEVCDSLDSVVMRGYGAEDEVALVAWQAMGGLLADEHRYDLQKLTRHLRLVVMVPRAWARLLDTTDLGGCVGGIIPKPFEADELLTALRAAMSQVSPAASASSSA
jgi:DNA-binding response OmpR family regulator